MGDNEIVTVEAQLNYVRARLGSARQSPFIPQGFVSVAVPFESFDRAQRGAGRMGTMAAPAPGSRGLTSLGSVALQPSRPSFGFSRAGIGSSFPIVPFGYAGNSYELDLRLNDLLQRRAGLDALWRELENEARIAKVPQVWLAR